MKKVFALLLALCLLCVSAAALAEVVSGEKAVELDDFTLNLKDGEAYQVAEKVVNQPYVMVYPYYGAGDQSTNYNVVWMGGVFEMTLDQLKAEAGGMEETLRAQFEPYGVTLNKFEASEPYEASLNGVPCLAIELTLEISAMGQNMTVYERQIAVGSIGYIFTISAGSAEDLEKATQSMSDALAIPVAVN